MGRTPIRRSGRCWTPCASTARSWADESGSRHYIRVGKRLPVTATEVLVELRPPPQVIFHEELPGNSVRFRLGPEVVIAIGARAKAPERRWSARRSSSPPGDAPRRLSSGPRRGLSPRHRAGLMYLLPLSHLGSSCPVQLSRAPRHARCMPVSPGTSQKLRVVTRYGGRHGLSPVGIVGSISSLDDRAAHRERSRARRISAGASPLGAPPEAPAKLVDGWHRACQELPA